MMGAPYEGKGLRGYDNFKNMHVGSWSSNMDAHLPTKMGMRNPKTGEFRFYGQMDEPMMKLFGRLVKHVTRIVASEKHWCTILDLHAGGGGLSIGAVRCLGD